MTNTLQNDSDKYENEDDNFVWQDYLDTTNTVEVPQVLFAHVEQSLQTGLQEGMMLEVPHKNSTDHYWFACINMVCGPLLRLRSIGQEDNRSKDFWCDLTKVKVHPLGWCTSQRLNLKPPEELKEKLIDVDIKSLIEEVLENGKSVPPELLSGDGFTPVERIKQGMKVEVQENVNPYHLWVATIIENVGGRLLLRYDSPDSSSPDFWLFYNSPRLFRIGWTALQGAPYILRKPSYLKTSRSVEEWERVNQHAIEEAKKIPVPPDLFLNMLPSSPHYFEVGMKLEAIHPHNMVEICPATICKVFDSYYFLVKVDSDKSSDVDIESSWLCTAAHPYIFPIGWAKNHGLRLTHPSGWTTKNEEFDWQEYLSCTNSYPAPEICFSARISAAEMGFEVGMKLEAVNPENLHQICAASVVKVLYNLLWISLDSHDSFHPHHIVSMQSVDIFPVGWCESNLYSLKSPLLYHCQIKMQQRKEESPKKEAINSTSASQQKSCWCPKIYFNHKCFSGPFLSKGKLAQLPKAVGPGPVTLVMREVLGMLISVAYKSSRVLKELQCDGKPEAGMHLEVLKAKYKNNTYRASVAVVTSADQVPSFCKSICTRLQVCPFMFGPVSIGENNCPENCNTLSKTRFTQYWVQGKRKIGRPKGETSNLVPRPKKKRGRKKLIHSSKIEEGTLDNAKENDPSLNKCNGVTGTATTQQPVVRRKYRKKEFPRTAMKTRGAKLPNFALQIKASHWPHKNLVLSSNETTRSDKTRDVPHLSSDSSGSHKSNGGHYEDIQEPMEFSEIKVENKARASSADILELESNPLYWSEDDVYQYLMKTDDCSWLAQKCKEEMIDGQAFMMLNLPTLKEHLCLKTTAALQLCNHIQRIKLAYYLQYMTDSEP